MRYILDTTVLIKAIFPPRRKKKDAVYEEQLRLHAVKIMKSIEGGADTMALPFLALVETAAVGARSTGQAGLGKEAVSYVRSHATFLSDIMIHDESVDVPVKRRRAGSILCLLRAPESRIQSWSQMTRGCIRLRSI